MNKMNIILLGILLISNSIHANSLEDGKKAYNKFDYTNALLYYNNACNAGYAEGCSALAGMYSVGAGVKPNDIKSYELNVKACSLGGVNECSTLGDKYFFGKGINKDYFKAVKFYSNACKFYTKYFDNKNDDFTTSMSRISVAVGCNNLGQMYHKGLGVKLDNFKAKEFFGKACDLQVNEGCENYAAIK